MILHFQFFKCLNYIYTNYTYVFVCVCVCVCIYISLVSCLYVGINTFIDAKMYNLDVFQRLKCTNRYIL